MSELVITNESLDADHRSWDHEHLGWMTEIQGWRTDYKDATRALAEIKERLSDYGKELDEHSRIIAEHQQRLRDHGRAMDEYQQMGHDVSEAFQASMTKVHLDQKDQHGTSRAVHDAMKSRNSNIMARLSSLLVATGAGDVPSE